MASKSVPVDVVHLDSGEQFNALVYSTRQPAVLRSISLGRAPSLWTPEYLAEKGGDKPAKLHVSPVPQMNFIHKNFSYRTLPFNEFVKRANEDKHTDYFLNPEEKYYLRSLGDDPRKDTADFKKQYPELAADITLPIYCTPEDYFSSVLRIGSAGVQLWTHYDVMDNLLVQVTGRKRVVLFSPQEVNNLYLVGDKSKVLDIDTPDLTTYPRFACVTHHECFLEADFSVAVNVFWKHLDTKLYDPKDTYGNKDLLPAQRAHQIVDRALKALEELPGVYKDFYTRCLISRIEEKSCLCIDDS